MAAWGAKWVLEVLELGGDATEDLELAGGGAGDLELAGGGAGDLELAGGGTGDLGLVGGRAGGLELAGVGNFVGGIFVPPGAGSLGEGNEVDLVVAGELGTWGYSPRLLPDESSLPLFFFFFPLLFDFLFELSFGGFCIFINFFSTSVQQENDQRNGEEYT